LSLIADDTARASQIINVARARRMAARRVAAVLCMLHRSDVYAFTRARRPTTTAAEKAAATTSSTVSLDEYRERIGNLALEIDALIYPDEEDADDALRGRQADEVVARVRAEIGNTETVTWGEQRITPDNRWVYEQLAAYEQGANLTPAARRDLLRVLAGRLQALREHTDEAAGAPTAHKRTRPTRTKKRRSGGSPEFCSVPHTTARRGAATHSPSCGNASPSGSRA
jgi:hypothetical protein